MLLFSITFSAFMGKDSFLLEYTNRILFFGDFPAKNIKPTKKNTTLFIPEDLIIYNMTFSDKRNISMSKAIFDQQTTLRYNIGEPVYCADVNFFRQNVVVARDVFVSKSSSISNVTHNFAVVPFYDVNKLFIFDSGWEKDVIAYEEEIIAFGHVHMTCFGHVFYDLFTPLMLLPAEIFNRAKLIKEVLDMLGKPVSL